MPAPPPPPPMAPAAPPQPVFSPAKHNADDRGALLKSIRQGAKLKKTVTNDKSAPMIAGKINTTGNNNGSTSNESSTSFSATVPANGLGGLFAGGMPKLKPTGKLATTNNSTKPLNNNDEVTSTLPTASKNFSSIQLELKKQLANDNRNRGPPPPAPNRTMPGDSIKHPFTVKENVSNGLHLSHLALNANSSSLHSNSSTLHRKTKSNANLSTLDSADDVNNGFVPTRPVISHGKPNLAPKPPILNGKPAAPQKKNGKPISRAHSMRSPRSPSPQSPEGNPANKFGTVRHMSSIISQSLSNSSGHPQRIRTPLNSRPSAPPPSIPAQVSTLSPVQSHAPPPPPPPSKTNAVKHPNHAPPPPPAPNHAPPPPPHKTQPARQPPSIPANNNTNPPPPPPPRNSSMRDTPTTKRVIIDLDEKFKQMFQTPEKFPQPPPYRNILKMYSYKQGAYLKSGV